MEMDTLRKHRGIYWICHCQGSGFVDSGEIEGSKETPMVISHGVAMHLSEQDTEGNLGIRGK